MDRGLLKVPWTAKRSSQSVLKVINPEYSLEGLMLKLQYFSRLMQSTNSLEKILILGKVEGRRRSGWQATRWLDSITDSVDMSPLSRLWERVKDKEVWHAVHMGITKSQTQLSDWTTMRTCYIIQGAKLGALWQPKGVGGSRGRGYSWILIHVDVWQKPDNTVKQLSSK